MPKFDTLDALNDETTSMLKTLTHSLSFSGSKRYIYIGGNKSFGAHTAESLCFQWEQIYCIKHKRSQTTAALTMLILTATAPKKIFLISYTTSLVCIYFWGIFLTDWCRVISHPLCCTCWSVYTPAGLWRYWSLEILEIFWQHGSKSMVWFSSMMSSLMRVWWLMFNGIDSN